MASCLIALSAQAQMYKCTDSTGQIGFQDRPCKGQKQKQLDAKGREIKEAPQSAISDSKVNGVWYSKSDDLTLTFSGPNKLILNDGVSDHNGSFRKENDHAYDVQFSIYNEDFEGAVKITDTQGIDVLLLDMAGEEIKFLKKSVPKNKTKRSSNNSKPQELSSQSLQGKWLATEFMDAAIGPDFGTEYWIFKGDQYTYVSGQEIDDPVPYKIDNNKIRLSYDTFTVLSFDGQTMKTVDNTGMRQTFEKQ